MAAQQRTGGIEPRRATLWSLTNDEQLLEAIVSDAETDDEARAMAQEFLDDNRQSQIQKVDSYCSVINQLSARGKARKDESDRLGELARIDMNRAKDMIATLKEWWQRRGLTGPLQTARHRVSLAKNGGVLPLEIDREELPAGFRSWNMAGTTYLELRGLAAKCPAMIGAALNSMLDDLERGEPEKERIRKALEAGDSVPGARLGERGESLRIK